jgi:shikimate 5-dehydrogenase
VESKIYVISSTAETAVTLSPAQREAYGWQTVASSQLHPEVLADELVAIAESPDCCALLLGPGLRRRAAAACRFLSPAAELSGAVDTLLYTPDGLYGHNTLAEAFVTYLKSQALVQIRTALVLGSGFAARSALAGLKELGCTRYVVAFRSPERPAEISNQFRWIRRQLSFFPLIEMDEFFTWAEDTGVLTPVEHPDTEYSGAERELDKGEKRWNILVNATPVGGVGDPRHVLSSGNLLTSVNRVLDFAATDGDSNLLRLARRSGVIGYAGSSVAEVQGEVALKLWKNGPPPEHLSRRAELPREPRRYVLRRRRGSG